jgi:general secretion pathway protein D
MGTPAWSAPLPGETEALHECRRYPPDKHFRWELRGQVDLQELLGAMAPMLCRPIIVSANIRPPKVTILAPETLTAAEAYRMFLSALETMNLTVQPEGKVLKVIESHWARQEAIPTYTGEAPAQDQFVTRLFRLENVAPDDVKPVLDRLRGRDGDITTYAPTNTLVITDLATNVRRMEEVARQLDVPLGGERIFIIQLQHVPASEMATMLQTIFNVKNASSPRRYGQPPRGTTPLATLGPDLAVSQIIPNDPRNLLVVVSSENAYRRMLGLVERLDHEGATDAGAGLVHVIPLENADADSVAGTLAGIGVSVSKSGASASPARRGFQPRGAPQPAGPFESEVRVVADKLTNSLIVLAAEHDFLTLRDLIAKLDIPRRQVFVEADILEVTVDKSRNIGVAWHGGSTIDTSGQQSLLFGGSEPSSDVNSILFSPAALSGLAAGLRGPPIPGADTILGLPPGTSIPSFGVFLQLLQNNGDVNVVSMPHILTTDNEKATIQVGQNLPFPGALGGFPGFGGTTGLPGTTFGFGTSVQRQDVALKLEITPHVNDSDYVRLELNNELSDVANPNYNGLGPATSKRTVKSVVTVKDQQSIVLGGLIKDGVSSTVQKVPLLGDIPIIGYLFKSTKKTITKQNLLIILTPYIIKDPTDLRRVFERKLRERREFLERYSAFRDERDYEAEIDYRRKRGLLEEINRAAAEADEEAADLRAAESKIAHTVDGPVEPAPAPDRKGHDAGG